MSYLGPRTMESSPPKNDLRFTVKRSAYWCPGRNVEWGWAEFGAEGKYEGRRVSMKIPFAGFAPFDAVWDAMWEALNKEVERQGGPR